MATRRRKAKTAAKRSRARRSGTKKRSTKKRSTTRKPKAKTRTPARAKRTVKKGAATKGRARTTRPARTPAVAKPRPRTPAAASTGAAPARSVAPERAEAFTAPAAAAAAPGDGLSRDVAEELRKRGYDAPDPTVVAVLTDVGEGYRQGPAHAPAWLQVDVDGPIAEGIVERFATGDRAHDIDRSTHRPQVRAAVDFNLALLAPRESIGDSERDVLTSFCLGSWDPAMNANAERDGIATFVVPWYLAGRG